jgi:heme biosynthesis-associated TPR repeat protein
MKPLLWTLFFLLLIGLGVNFLLEDNGYVLVQFLEYSLETSLPIFGLILVAVYLLVRLIVLVWSSPGILKQRLIAKKIKKSNQRIFDGLDLMSRGEFTKAEKKIKSALRDRNSSVFPYLLVAEASQKEGKMENCIDWLEKAKKKFPEIETYINLHAAKLMVESKNYEAARKSINATLNQEPNNPIALKLLAEVSYRACDWESLTQKAKTTLNATSKDLKLESYFSEAFSQQAKSHSGNIEELKNLWIRLPSQIENNATIMASKFESTMSSGQHESVEKELRRAIPKTWNRQLISLYAKLDAPDLTTLSKRVERWLVDRPRDSNLWLTASQLAKRDELWTQAKQFLERSLENKETSLAYNELGLILLELGQENEAIKAFNKALDLKKNR